MRAFLVCVHFFVLCTAQKVGSRFGATFRRRDGHRACGKGEQRSSLDFLSLGS